MSSFSLKSFFTSDSKFSQLSPIFSLIPSIVRLFLLEQSSKSTNLLWTYSGSSCHSYISQIHSSRCSAFYRHFCTFSSSTFSVNSMLFLRSFISVFMDLVSFIAISRLQLTRLSKFPCFSNFSLNISLIKVVNFSSLKHVLSLLCAIFISK